MKIKHCILSIITILAISTSGCAWFKAHPQAPEAIAQQVATSVSREVLISHPEFRPKFEIARDKLRLLEAQPIVTAQDVVNIVNLLPAKYLTTQTARLTVDGLTITVQLTGNPALPAETSAQLQKIVTGLRVGLDATLGTM